MVNQGEKAVRNRGVAILLCFFLGWWGVHHFYLGNSGVGILYLLSSTVGICLVLPPIIIGLLTFVDFLGLLVMSDADFDRRYNATASLPPLNPSDITRALAELKQLYEDGVITAEEYEHKRRDLLRRL